MSRTDRIALILALVAVAAAYLVADRVFERIPHIEDEMAYTWQAQAIAEGKIVVPSPPSPKSMLVPFVVDYQGQRFGKYPLGWPALLGIGVLLGLRDWVNPFLAGLGLWLIYLIGKKVFSERVGLLAIALTLISPFFLLNSGSLLSHPWALVLSAGFVLAWFDTFRLGEKTNVSKKLTTVTAGACLGMLGMTRPLTAVAVGLPFAVHGLVLLVRSDRATRLRVLSIGALAALIAGLVLLWQFAVTGNPLLNPYTLWWPYDKIGFGIGYGNVPGGNTLSEAWINTKYSFKKGSGDFFGWGYMWWVFVPFGLWSLRKKLGAWLVALIMPTLVVVYLSYWIGSWLYGPRYYYEGFYSLTLVTAAGILWLFDAVKTGRFLRLRRGLLFTALTILIGSNLFLYLPGRLSSMYGLYGITRAQMDPFLAPEAQSLPPSLVIVHYTQSWTEFGALLPLENPDLTSHFIFALSLGTQQDAAVAKAYPHRHIVQYYPQRPESLYRLRP